MLPRLDTAAGFINHNAPAPLRQSDGAGANLRRGCGMFLEKRVGRIDKKRRFWYNINK